VERSQIATSEVPLSVHLDALQLQEMGKLAPAGLGEGRQLYFRLFWSPGAIPPESSVYDRIVAVERRWINGKPRRRAARSQAPDSGENETESGAEAEARFAEGQKIYLTKLFYPERLALYEDLHFCAKEFVQARLAVTEVRDAGVFRGYFDIPPGGELGQGIALFADPAERKSFGRSGSMPDGKGSMPWFGQLFPASLHTIEGVLLPMLVVLLDYVVRGPTLAMVFALGLVLLLDKLFCSLWASKLQAQTLIQKSYFV